MASKHVNTTPVETPAPLPKVTPCAFANGTMGHFGDSLWVTCRVLVEGRGKAPGYFPVDHLHRLKEELLKDRSFRPEYEVLQVGKMKDGSNSLYVGVVGFPAPGDLVALLLGEGAQSDASDFNFVKERKTPDPDKLAAARAEFKATTNTVGSAFAQ